MAVDWSIGSYERTAEQLVPAARALVDKADPRPGERVVDVGCGTGNVALLAAERGARVTGVDPAARLLDVARADAEARGLAATFAAGDAGALPVGDGEAGLVMSNFGVIFASDAGQAAAELARVTAPAGRIVFTAWIPGGPVGRAVALFREAMARATGGPPPGAGPPPFAWHERDAIAALFAPHGFGAEVQEERISFTGSSPAEYMDSEMSSHPFWVAARPLLEARGELDELRARTLEIFEAANEDPGALRVTSRYVIATVSRA